MQQFNYQYVSNYIEEFKKKTAILKAEKENKINEINNIDKSIQYNIKKQENLQLISKILNKASGYAREQCKTSIENIVTNALQFVLDKNNIRFEIDLNINKISAQCYFVLEINGEESKQDVLHGNSGGYLDIVSTALKIAYMIIYKQVSVNNILILDEPGKAIDMDSSVRFAEFIKTISANYGIQVLMVTHNSNLKSIADRTFQVEINENVESMVTTL